MLRAIVQLATKSEREADLEREAAVLGPEKEEKEEETSEEETQKEELVGGEVVGEEVVEAVEGVGEEETDLGRGGGPVPGREMVRDGTSMAVEAAWGETVDEAVGDEIEDERKVPETTRNRSEKQKKWE